MNSKRIRAGRGKISGYMNKVGRKKKESNKSWRRMVEKDRFAFFFLPLADNKRNPEKNPVVSGPKKVRLDITTENRFNFRRLYQFMTADT
jgi:hypothetical protein